MSIVINLPVYDTQYKFNRAQFLSLFPDSMISTAFQDPDETSIDLTHHTMTPDILEYLHNTVKSNMLLPIKDNQNFQEVGRYLLIPILEVISQSEYTQFHETYPKINLLEKQSLRDNYSTILVYALLHNYSSLLHYLWNEIGSVGHDNYDALFVSAYKNNMHVMTTLLKDVNLFDYKSIKYKYFRDLVHLPYNPALDTYLANKHLSVSEVCMLGNANDTLRLIYDYDVDKDNMALVIATINKNMEGIKILYPVSPTQAHYDALDHSGTNLQLNGLLMGINDDFSVEHIYETAWISTLPHVATRFIPDVSCDVAIKHITENLHILSTISLQRILRMMDTFRINKFLEWARGHNSGYLISYITTYQKSIE